MLDAAGGFQLIVDRRNELPVFSICQPLLDELPRDLRHGEERLGRQSHFWRGHAGFRNRGVENVTEARRRIDQKFGDDAFCDVVEAFLGARRAFVNVVMRNQLLVIAVREFGVVTDEF